MTITEHPPTDATADREATTGHTAWHPADPAAARAEARRWVPTVGATALRAVVLPHGAWRDIGTSVGAALAAGTVEETLLVLAPEHGRRTPRAALLPIDVLAGVARAQFEPELQLIDAIRTHASLPDRTPEGATVDPLSTLGPLLGVARDRLSAVVVSVNPMSPSSCKRLGLALAEVVGERGSRVTWLASSDFGHYISSDAAAALAKRIATTAAALDGDALAATIDQLATEVRPSGCVCGAAALQVLVHALGALGSPSGRLTHFGVERRAGKRAGVALGSIAYPAAQDPAQAPSLA